MGHEHAPFAPCSHQPKREQLLQIIAVIRRLRITYSICCRLSFSITKGRCNNACIQSLCHRRMKGIWWMSRVVRGARDEGRSVPSPLVILSVIWDVYCSVHVILSQIYACSGFHAIQASSSLQFHLCLFIFDCDQFKQNYFLFHFQNKSVNKKKQSLSITNF